MTPARPAAAAQANANRTIRSLPCSEISLTEIPLSARTVRPVVAPMNAISSATASVPISSSMPAYRSSVFSRTTTRSTRPYGEGTPS